MKRFSKSLARFIERWPWLIILVVVVLSAAAVPGITMLKTETGFEAFVSPDAKISQDNSRYQEQFGGESITILLSGELDDIFSGGNLAVMTEFEKGLSEDSRYISVTGPLTFIRMAQDEASQARQSFHEQVTLAQEEAAAEAMQTASAMGLNELQQEQAAEQARAEVLRKLQPRIEQIQLMGEPALENPLFVKSVLYDADGAVSQVMQAFVPDTQHALILVTPRGNMSDEAALQATRSVEDFFADNPLEQVDTTIISSAKLVNAISVSMGNNLTILLGLSVLVMFVILVVMFRVRWRLLSLFMVGISALWTFGIMGYFSVPLTMATMAVLPILIGLGIDFSIQFHNRYQEEITRSHTVGEAIINSISQMLPVVGVALIATIIGFVTLFISEVPMIRDFGMMLAIGVSISYMVGLFLLHSIIYLGDKRTPIKLLKESASRASGRIERILSRIGKLAVNQTRWIFIIALLFGIAGGIIDHWLPVNTDYAELMSQDTVELVELRELRGIVGSGGMLNLMIEADDVTNPGVLKWLQEYQERVILSHPELISVTSPAALVSEAAGGIIPAQEQINEILANIPEPLLAHVLSVNRSMASASFSIKYISLAETHALLQAMQEEAMPPAGVRISPVGSLALGSSTIDAIVGARLTMNLLCLGAIFIILMLVYRRLGSVIFIIIPVGVVIAWASLDMYLMGIPLNPLTAILGIIIIGICTEFMVLLMGRYEEEKLLGLSPEDAMVTAISKIGRAIVTTALTTVGGFGVLIASDFVMTRDFGIATVVGVILSLIMTITVMPGLIVWYDNWRKKRLPG